VSAPSVAPAERRWAIRFILCFGLVSLFADMTYEGAHGSIGPMLNDLGASVASVAVISGLGEMIAASLRFFSGRFADRTRAYWTIVTLGYALNLLAIPGLAFAKSWPVVALLIVAERTGKAIRGPARDVLLSEATGVIGHGSGFGIHAAMDQIGAVAGPLLLGFAIVRLGGVAPAYLILAVPAVLALAALLLAHHYRHSPATPPTPKAAQPLPRVFWLYVFASGILACGFFDFPLLNYHLTRTGLIDAKEVAWLYAAAMGATGLTALVCGRLFDRFGVAVLIFGILVTMLALPLGFLGGKVGGVVAILFWGAGLGVQDATLRAGIARVVSMNKRGAAFGSFNGVFGVMWFLGSAVMGLLYDHSVVALVLFGLALQLAAAAMFVVLRRPLAQAAGAAG
jgi:MFS family permease